MTDIRHYSDQELSLRFLNDEGLYKEFMKGVRYERFNDIKHLCDELFIYTDEQLEELIETFWAEI
jgi:thymidylate synthase ThyX